MTLTYRAILAVVQLVFFVPGFCFAIFLASRHGFGKSAGWYFLIAFTLLRTVGAICEIVAVVTSSLGAYIAAVVCSSIGLAPLTLLCLGLLSRVNNTSTRHLPSLIFKCISLFSLIGLILGIVGGSSQSNSQTTLIIRPESKAAVIIFCLVFSSTVALLCWFSLNVNSVLVGERRILVCVALTIPFICVRVIYALIADFAGLPDFNIVSGNNTIYLCMAVLMEIIAAYIIIGFGMSLHILPKAENTESEQMGMGSERIDTTHSTTRQNHRSKARGPISYLFYAAKDVRESK